MILLLTSRRLAFCIVLSLAGHLPLLVLVMATSPGETETRSVLTVVFHRAPAAGGGAPGPAASPPASSRPVAAAVRRDIDRSARATPPRTDNAPAALPPAVTVALQTAPPGTVAEADETSAAPPGTAPVTTTPAAGSDSMTGGDSGPFVGNGATLSGADDRPPTFLSGPRPAYPVVARTRGWSGEVLLRIDVACDGSVSNVSVERPSGYAVLDQAALAAVRSWQFQPGLRAGIPAPATVLQPLHFVVNDGSRAH